MKIVFMGGNDFSLESLKKLYYSQHEIVGVVCQVDKPNSRGNKIEVCPVKSFAIEKGLKVFQFKKIREEGVETLKSLNPDLVVVVSYGQILSDEIINLARYGTINVHASLLPKYRGASPIISAILNSENETGITIMRIEKEVDSGNIILQEKVAIISSDNAETLSKKLAVVGSNLLCDAINLIEEGKAVETVQDHSKATFTKMIKKEDGFLDFSKTATEVNNKIRAFNPNPVAFIKIKDEKFKIYEAEVVSADESIDFGKIICSCPKDGLIIKCGKDAIKILKIQASGGKVLDAKSFLNGRKFEK